MSKKVAKRIGISISALLVFICLVVIFWYVGVLLTGKDKVISKTFEVGALTLADGTQHNIMEIEYFANKDNSGYEAFEIKYNYFMDETKQNIYSQGFQYIANSGSSIGIGYAHNDEKVIFDTSNYNLITGWNKYYKCQNAHFPFNTTSTYNYMSVGGQYLKSTNPIDLDSYFKIQIGEDLYLMQFKGLDTPMNETTFKRTIKYDGVYTDKFHHQYYIYEAHYLSKILYESIKGAEIGTNDDIVFEFGNYFNYFKYNAENGAYDEEKTSYDETVKITEDIKSYYSIHVKTHEYGLSRAQDSMFNSVLGNQNFNLNGDNIGKDYFVGRTVVDCDISSFDFVVVQDNNIAFKLKDTFIDYYITYKDTIVLSIVIDLDLLENLGYTFVGFTADNSLNYFKIYECYSISAGEVIEDYTSSLKVVSV